MSEVSRSTGKWSKPGVPHRGWTCVDIEDLEEPSATCEMCESQEIRYVHRMTHPDYQGELGVGCVCAGRMEEDYEGAKRREAVVRNAAGRKRRWLSRKWLVSRNGNPYINTDGYNVVIFDRKQGRGEEVWGFKVTNRITDDHIEARKPYPTCDAAKLRAFDAILWMKDRSR